MASAFPVFSPLYDLRSSWYTLYNTVLLHFSSNENEALIDNLCLFIAVEVMFLLGTLYLVSVAVSLSSGQNSHGGLVCNFTSSPYSWDEVSAFYNVTTCDETFSDMEECNSWDTNYTCEPQSQMECSAFDSGLPFDNLNVLSYGPTFLN